MNPRSPRSPRALVVSALVLLGLLLLAPRAALAKGTFRTVLVIDASSSMLSTDPKEIRKVGAELYVDLARDGDQIAVTGFDGGVRESMGGFVTIRGPADRETLKRAIRAVGKNGSWTDFTAGLSEAKRLLAAAPDEAGDQELVVFLTDGKCDPDPQGPFAALRKPGVLVEQICQRKVIDEILPELRPARIYAVGLSRGAPRSFLEEVGRLSGGAGVATDRADELPRLFADAYARVLGSKISDGPAAESVSITVDEGVLTLDVVLVGPPALTVKLTGPAGAEIPIDNARPAETYFVRNDAYRLYKIARPAPGAYRLAVTGAVPGGRAGPQPRYVALQGLDLSLDFVDLPEVVEIGKSARIKVRLGSPAGKTAPLDFLDRHTLTLSSAVSAAGRGAIACKEALKAPGITQVPLRHGADGVYEATQPATTVGEMCFEVRMVPASGGVLTATLGSPVIRMVIPLRLKAAPVKFGDIKQDEGGKATLSFEGSEIGEPLEVDLSLVTKSKALELEPGEAKLEPKGARTFGLTLDVDRDAKSGRRVEKLLVQPKKPTGYEDRRIEVDVEVNVVPLTFWERYGFWIEVGAGVLVFLILLFGFVAPARFRKGSVLHYKDGRDADLPREGSYPLAAKAKAGFYRGARLLVGPGGPVRSGGVIELRAGPGGGVIVRPLGGARVHELPRESEGGASSYGDKRQVSLVKGMLRAGVSTKYEVEGTGLTFWYTLR